MFRHAGHRMLLAACLLFAVSAVAAQVVADDIVGDVAVLRAAARPLRVLTAAAEEPAAGDPADEAGGSEPEDGNVNYWKYTHAVLMSVAWVGLLPLGILSAQSRWARPMKTPTAGKDVWFWLHMFINITGVALVIAAFAIAVTKSTHMEIEKDDGSLAYSHKVLGVITFVLMLAQVVVAFIRPHPGEQLRGIWNFLHHNLGRLAMLLAWATIWLGVAWWQADEGVPGGIPKWVAPLAAAQGVILLVYLLNQVLKKRAEKNDKMQQSGDVKPAGHNNGVQHNGMAA